MFIHKIHGNADWVVLALIMLYLAARLFLHVKREHSAGVPVDVPTVILFSIVILYFLAHALFQVLTHPW